MLLLLKLMLNVTLALLDMGVLSLKIEDKILFKHLLLKTNTAKVLLTA